MKHSLDFKYAATPSLLASLLAVTGCTTVATTDLQTCYEQNLTKSVIPVFQYSATDKPAYNSACAVARNHVRLILEPHEDGSYNFAGIMLGKEFYKAASPEIRKFIDVYLGAEGLAAQDLPTMSEDLRWRYEISRNRTDGKSEPLNPEKPFLLCLPVSEHRESCSYVYPASGPAPGQAGYRSPSQILREAQLAAERAAASSAGPK